MAAPPSVKVQSEDASKEAPASTFQSRAHKLAALFIMTAGSAHASRFPTMFIIYGGIPFLLAYLAFLVTVAMPLLYLEGSLAQFAGDGNRGIFSAVPLFMGLGYTMSLYAIVHVLRDSVTLSEHLLHFVGSLRNLTWNECSQGVVGSDRACYDATRQGHAPLCKSVRGRLVESFRRQQLDRGLPASNGDLLALVPAREYREGATACVPGVYDPLHGHHMRRAGIGWSEGAFDEIRVHPLLSLAAVWMLVFALANRGFTTVKNFLYVMVFLHVTTGVVLLARALTLTGAFGGLRSVFYADWSALANIEMWSDALYVSLESVGVTGTMYLGIARFNDFQNIYQEDVAFVLVADTASKGLRTVIAFMFLGHLSSTVDIDITTLVTDSESHFVAGTMEQAMSAVPYQEFWSHVHSLWLISTMLPKFLIVPEIILEVLAASHPLVLTNRSVVHFFVCSFMVVVSILVCNPGGASIAAIFVHRHDQNLRFFVLFLECVVMLQFCGMRRLDIISNMMTELECSMFVKICWAALIPVAVISLFYAEVAVRPPQRDKYSTWIYAIMVWLDIMHLSFIPVFAIVFMNESRLSVGDSLFPLPTWMPAGWERAMFYRQMVAAEGMDTEAREEGVPPARLLPPPQPKVASKQSPKPDKKSDSWSTEFMGVKRLFVLARKKFLSPSSEGWRDDSLGESASRAVKPGTILTPVSGTLHVSRRLSSVRRSVLRAKSSKPAPDDRGLEKTLTAPLNVIRESQTAPVHQPQAGTVEVGSLVEQPLPPVVPPVPDAQASQHRESASSSESRQGADSTPFEKKAAGVRNGVKDPNVQDPVGLPEENPIEKLSEPGEEGARAVGAELDVKPTGQECVADVKVSEKDARDNGPAWPEDIAIMDQVCFGASRAEYAEREIALAEVDLSKPPKRKLADATAHEGGKSGQIAPESQPNEPLEVNLQQPKAPPMHQRKMKRHMRLPGLLAKANANTRLKKTRPANADDTAPGKLATQPSPSWTTMDKTTAFRSFLRNVLLRPGERAEVLRRIGRDPAEERATTRSVSSAWDAVQNLEAYQEDAFKQQDAAVSTSTAPVAPTVRRQQKSSDEATILGAANVVSAITKHDGSKVSAETTVAQPSTSVPCKDSLPLLQGAETSRVPNMADAVGSKTVSAAAVFAALKAQGQSSGAATTKETGTKPKVSSPRATKQSELKHRPSGGSIQPPIEHKPRRFGAYATLEGEGAAKLPGVLVDPGSKHNPSGNQHAAASEEGRLKMGSAPKLDVVTGKAGKHARVPGNIAGARKETKEVRKEAKPEKRPRHVKKARSDGAPAVPPSTAGSRQLPS